MHQENRLQIADLIVFLRNKLLEAREGKNQRVLLELSSAMEMVREASWNNKDQVIGSFMDDMIAAIQDSFIGVEWKSDIPSVETIRSSLID